jgi:hypothetical protein
MQAANVIALVIFKQAATAGGIEAVGLSAGVLTGVRTNIVNFVIPKDRALIDRFNPDSRKDNPHAITSALGIMAAFQLGIHQREIIPILANADMLG